MRANRFILTGAPGAGKTTLLGHLGPGIRHVAEPAREVLAQQRSVDGHGIPSRDPALFLELLLRRSIDKYREAETWDGPVLYDRGVPDCVAYALRLGVDPAASVLASQTYRYHPEVLVLQPWEAIYTVDDERTMSFADTLSFHELFLDAYRQAGYGLIQVPQDSIAKRAAFIREFISARS